VIWGLSPSWRMLPKIGHGYGPGGNGGDELCLKCLRTIRSKRGRRRRIGEKRSIA
jgi:hypothetical protein